MEKKNGARRRKGSGAGLALELRYRVKGGERIRRVRWLRGGKKSAFWRRPGPGYSGRQKSQPSEKHCERVSLDLTEKGGDVKEVLDRRKGGGRNHESCTTRCAKTGKGPYAVEHKARSNRQKGPRQPTKEKSRNQEPISAPNR